MAVIVKFQLDHQSRWLPGGGGGGGVHAASDRKEEEEER